MTSSSDIARISCNIINESKRKRYTLFSREAEKPIAIRYFILITVAQASKYLCLIFIGFFGDQDSKFKFNLYLNTPIPYTMAMYGFMAYHFKKTNDTRKYDTKIPLLISVGIQILIEMVIFMTVKVGDRNNDLTEIDVLDVKLLSSPLNITFMQFLFLSPFILIFKTLR